VIGGEARKEKGVRGFWEKRKFLRSKGSGWESVTVFRLLLFHEKPHCYPRDKVYGREEGLRWFLERKERHFRHRGFRGAGACLRATKNQGGGKKVHPVSISEQSGGHCTNGLGCSQKFVKKSTYIPLF